MFFLLYFLRSVKFLWFRVWLLWLGWFDPILSGDQPIMCHFLISISRKFFVRNSMLPWMYLMPDGLLYIRYCRSNTLCVVLDRSSLFKDMFSLSSILTFSTTLDGLFALKAQLPPSCWCLLYFNCSYVIPFLVAWIEGSILHLLVFFCTGEGVVLQIW